MTLRKGQGDQLSNASMVLPRKYLCLISITVLILLSGCVGLLGQSGPSVSDTQTEVVDDQPVMMFNYSVDDYSKVLLQHPNGQVVNEGTLEPNQTVGGMYMPSPSAGTYKLVVQQGGETVVEQDVVFNGAEPVVTSVETDWSGNVLQKATLSVENRGDLPARVSDPSVKVYGSNISGVSTTWVAPNETETISVSPSFQALTVNRPGDARGTITAQTGNGTISETFQETFAPANLSIENIDANWRGSKLESATISVRNTGDLPTTGNAILRHQGEDLHSSYDRKIPPGETVEFELTGWTLYRQTSGGTVELDVVINSSDGFTEGTISHTAASADIALESISPHWQNGQLTSVDFTVMNSGDLETDFTTAVEVGGSEVEEQTFSIAGGSTETYTVESSDYLSNGLYTVQSGGEVPVTVSVEGDAGTDSRTNTASFEGVDVELSGVDPLFTSEYGSDNKKLSSITFSIRNQGDIPLVYDAVRLSIDGVSQTVSPYSATTIEVGSSTSESLFPDGSLSVSPGSHELTIELRRSGSTVATEGRTVSTTGS